MSDAEQQAADSGEAASVEPLNPHEFRVDDVVVIVQPAAVVPEHVIEDPDATPGLAYAAQALRVRHRIGKQVLMGATWALGHDGSTLCLFALQDAGLSLDEAQAFAEDLPPDDLFRMVAAACGYYHETSRIRSAMLACAAIGLGDVQLTAHEALRLADWAWNNGRAPGLHSESGGKT